MHLSLQPFGRQAAHEVLAVSLAGSECHGSEDLAVHPPSLLHIPLDRRSAVPDCCEKLPARCLLVAGRR